MRVQPRWRAERVGYVTDLEAWVPLADGGRARPGAGEPGRRRDRRAGHRHHDADPARVRDQRRARRGQVPAAAWPSTRSSAPGRRTPTRSTCRPAARTRRRGAPTTDRGRGRRHAGRSRRSASSTSPACRTARRRSRTCRAQILLDGGNTPWFGLIQGVPADEVRMGMRVHAIWAEELQGRRQQHQVVRAHRRARRRLRDVQGLRMSPPDCDRTAHGCGAIEAREQRS